jgi:hypothetical protein
MGYECKRCGAYYESQLKGRCHVHLEHGISWKKTRKALKWRENLVTHTPPSRRRRHRRFLHVRKNIGKSVKITEKKLSVSRVQLQRYIKKRAEEGGPNAKNVSKSRKARRIGNFVYKGYLRICSIFERNLDEKIVC